MLKISGPSTRTCLPRGRSPTRKGRLRSDALVDAAVSRLVLRLRRLCVALEIARRRHHGHAQRRPDRHCDHVPIDGLAEAHAGIESLGDDLAKAVAHVELERDVRVVAQPGRRLGKQHRAQHVVAACDADGAGGLVTQRRERVEFGLSSTNRWPIACAGRSPAVVGERLRVVRVRRRISNRSSSRASR